MCRHPRLRMENCVSTILDMNQHLGDGQIKPEIIRQFERLKVFLKVVSEDSVNEADIDRIEEATNHLLEEIRGNMEVHQINYRHLGLIN